MSRVHQLSEIARLPAPGDNTAIAIRRLKAGTLVSAGGPEFAIDHTVLEGHRFAVEPIPEGAALRSWGLRFGDALRDVQPGEYVRNTRMLEALRLREVDFPLPDEPNFRDTALEPYAFDEARFVPAPPDEAYPAEALRWFPGYDRGPRRGVGTRNDIVILATTSRAGAWARTLAERLRGAIEGDEHVDDIVAVSHTEGGAGRPNNLDLLLRTLAGFVVHPNVGAVLIVERGDEAVTNDLLRRYLREHGYPLDETLHRFVTLRDRFEADLERGEALLREWLPRVAATPRTRQPVSALKIGLQCGGSDAFSGVSGNPLAGWAAREIIRYGGAANLAETDELIGAEEYMLQNVRDLATARRFLETIERFKERVGWHGHTAEGNPSGGNLYRGLYNIAIKSLGAAMKRDPRVRLDHVIEYGEPMREPGFYFMDSPGNDLESIAGQVASGCNLMLFITGNGSITNFPFVPTIKIVTTSERYRLLSEDMDVNAGAYLDGTPMDRLGTQLTERIIAVAGGERSVGERAGHSQVSIWRDWQQTGPVDVARLIALARPSGGPLLRREDVERLELPAAERELAASTFRAINTPEGPRTDLLGLILPTSICSGQIARKIAERLNDRPPSGEHTLSRFVALPHTEGCGASSGVSEELYTRTMLGCLVNPLVARGLLLEHGCEKTHNDYFRHQLKRRGLDLERYGWASIQLDGGIEAVTTKVEEWFAAAEAGMPPRIHRDAPLADLRLGLAAVEDVPPEVRAALARLARVVVGAGGTVVTPQGAAILDNDAAWREMLGIAPPLPSLAYGDVAPGPGLHLMETPTAHWVEMLTGLGATGVEVILAAVGDRPVEGHPLVPVVQAAAVQGEARPWHADLDLRLGPDPSGWPAELLGLVLRVASRAYTPVLGARGNVDFQITRGRLGVSM